MKFKDSGDRTEFGTGAVRDAQGGKGRMDLLPFRAIMAVSKIYEAGCLKYGDRNWEKGIPLSRYVDSGLRHLFKWLTGWHDEPHLDMAIWNLLCLRDTLERIKEAKLPPDLDDLPSNPDKAYRSPGTFIADRATDPDPVYGSENSVGRQAAKAALAEQFTDAERTKEEPKPETPGDTRCEWLKEVVDTYYADLLPTEPHQLPGTYPRLLVGGL